RIRDFESIEAELRRRRMIPVVVTEPVEEIEHVARLPMRRTERTKQSSWIADARPYVAVERHRLGHRRLDGQTAEAAVGEDAHDLSHDRRPLARSLGQLAQAHDTRV